MQEMDSVLDKRNLWQNETLKELQKKMLNKNYIHNLNSAQKTVMVYGLPQVGKTSLILKILGIREDNECSQNLEKILRAGIKYGNSSTSTAIMYLHSNNDDFGISFKKFEEGLKKPEYFSNECAFEDKIREVRKEVESGNREVDIMCIYIPRKYFREDNSASSIDILDVPGVESKNDKEKSHLNKIMSHCFRLLDVCIIVCQSYKIINLGKRLEYISDYSSCWYEQPDKFIIVTTYSYSNETVINKVKTDSTYLNEIKPFYENKIREILGENNKIEVFPLELGTSLQTLKNNHPEYSQTIDESCNSILEQLIESIKAKKHDTLDKIVSSIKNELYSVITNQKVKLEKEQKKLIERIEELDKGLQECQAGIKSHRTEIEDLNNERKILKELRNLSPNIPDSFSIDSSYFSAFDNFKDKNKEFPKKIDEKLKEIRNAYIKKINEKFQDEDKKVDENCISISDIIDDQLDDLFYELYPATIWDRFKKITKFDLQYKVNDLFTVFCERLKDYVIEHTGIDQAITENGNELSRKQCLIYLLKNQKNELLQLQEAANNELAAVNEKMENLKIKLKNDTEILDNYLSIGYEQFLKQQSEIIANINSDETSAEEKAMYLLLLSLIDKDYSIICERGNLNE